MASSVNARTSKKSKAHHVVSQCFSLKFYRSSTAPQQNELGVSEYVLKVERFAVASSVNGVTLKKSMVHRVVSPCFSLKFYRSSTTPQQNALGVSRPLDAVFSSNLVYDAKYCENARRKRASFSLTLGVSRP